MKVTIEKLTDWDLVKRAALQTRNLKPNLAYPNQFWKLRMLRAEHSPIRCLMFYITFEDVPYYVHVHLVRHNVGLTPFVSTSRSDLTDVKDRSQRRQTDLVNFSMLINAQALINISKFRLCGKASLETQQLWALVKKEMLHIDLSVANMMNPRCVWQGMCPELKSCGLVDTSNYKEARDWFTSI